MNYEKLIIFKQNKNHKILTNYKWHNLVNNDKVKMTDELLARLYARAVLVLNEEHEIVCNELVQELPHEPSYDLTMKLLN